MAIDALKNMQNANISISKPNNIISEEKKPQIEQKKNGNALLLGSLAALAIGGGIYLVTKGRGGSKAAKNLVNETANETKNVIKGKIDSSLVEDADLKKVIEELNFEEFSDISENHNYVRYVSRMTDKLHMNLLKRFSNYNSPAEFSKAFEELNTKKYNIPENAFDICTDNIHFEKLLESVNIDRKNKILFAQNQTPQEKLRVIFNAYAEDSRVRILNRMKFNLPGIDSAATQSERNNIIEKYHKYVIENLKETLDFLTT